MMQKSKISYNQLEDQIAASSEIFYNVRIVRLFHTRTIKTKKDCRWEPFGFKTVFDVASGFDRSLLYFDEVFATKMSRVSLILYLPMSSSSSSSELNLFAFNKRFSPSDSESEE